MGSALCGVAWSQAKGSFQVWNWTSEKLVVYVNSYAQLDLHPNCSETYPLDFGDHRFEAYKGSGYYRYDFRLSPTTPYRSATIQDKDF